MIMSRTSVSLTILAQTNKASPALGWAILNSLPQQLLLVNNSPRQSGLLSFALSADILHIPPPPAPPRLSHLKIGAPKSPSPPPFREANLAAQATPHNQLIPHSLSHWARPCPRGQVTAENESGPSKAALTPLKGVCLDSFFEVGDCGRSFGSQRLSFPRPGPGRGLGGHPGAAGFPRPRLPPAPSLAGVSCPGSLTGHAAVHGGGLLCRYHVVVRHVEACDSPVGLKRNDRGMDIEICHCLGDYRKSQGLLSFPL